MTTQHWKNIFAIIILLFTIGYGLKSYTKFMIRKPLNVAKGTVPRGDFFTAFPGPHVEKYNPDLVKGSYTSAPGSKRTFMYGPVLHLVFFPFTFLKSINSASKGILIAYNLMFLAAFLIWYGLLFNKFTFVWPLSIMFLLWATFAPLKWTFIEFNIEILEMFLMSLSLFLLLKRKKYSAGIAMGFAAMTKVLPLIFLPYFFIKKEYKAMWGMTITLIVIGILTQIIYGWENNAMVKLAFAGQGVNTWFRIQSLNAVIYRFFSDFLFTVPNVLYPKAAYITSALVHVLLISSLCLAFFKQRKTQNTLLEFALLSTWMITTTPSTQMYYLCFLIFPFSVLLKFLWSDISTRDKWKMGLLFFIPYTFASFAFTHLKFIKYAFDEAFVKKYWDFNHMMWTFSIPGLGCFLLLVLMGWIYWHCENEKSIYYQPSRLLR